ncbi:MAG: AAA family ATPase [Candidatus Harrisonbacteria bacterium]|nr:AAA family ATPase [Candidatus Harrisonbacteria bacterium]
MRLKSLELVGFKSFAQKTTLDFTSGITAVVGPNGSGKSNIIDAIRWILGEREAKNIRGARAEDLIFAGTPQKPRMSMAKATMIFDNSDHFFPVDYDEVSITRKLGRDGLSEYLLNEAAVRLKDVVDFFAKARLGTHGLTIINQGNSDIFVKADFKERRAMVEEVLGLRQFQLKKHDAELKLISTGINLEKVKAMIGEIMPHLRLLRKQASKYEKQAEIEKELREFEAIYFGGKLFEIESEEKDLKPELDRIDESKKEKLDELKKLKSELEKVEKAGPKGDKGFQEFKKDQTALLAKRAATQKEIGRLEAQIEFIQNQPKSELMANEAVRLLEETKSEIQKIVAENTIEKIKTFLKSIIDRITDALSGGAKDRDGKLKKFIQDKERTTTDLKKADEELAELSKSEEKLAENLRGFNAIFKKAFEQVEAKKDEIQKLENDKNKLLFEKERLNIRLQELDHLARQSGRKLSEFQASRTEENFAELEKKMFKFRAELAGIGELDPSLIREAQETESRYNFLSIQMEDLEKASKDLKQLIEDLDEKIHHEFTAALKDINDQFEHYFKMMFGGGRASLKLIKPEKKAKLAPEEVTEENIGEEKLEDDAEHKVDHGGIEVMISIPRKKISSLDMLSGGEKSLVSIAALFALISVSPPPFLVLDEIDAPLDERNAKKFSGLIKDFSKKTQFILVTHNRATMEEAEVLYGVTMADDGTSRTLSLKLEQVPTP